MEHNILRLYLMAAALLTGFSTTYAQQSDLKAYNDFVNNIQTYSSLEYDVIFHQKLLTRKDTSSIKSHVELVRRPKDELFGGDVFIRLDTVWVGYNGDNILMGDHKNDELLFVDPISNPNALIKSTSMNELIVGRFLKFSDLVKQVLADTSLQVAIVDTTIDNINCLAVRITIPEYDGIKNEKLLMSFNKKTGFYHKNIHSFEFQGDMQYRVWDFSNPVFGHNTIIKGLEPSSVAAYKTINKYNTDTKVKTPVKNLGFIQGRLMSNQKAVSIAQDTSRFIFLDFWYAACYPCIKSIPVINRLKKEFEGQGISFYGVNFVDIDDASKEKLERFVVTNPMEYPTILVYTPIEDELALTGYPTSIILDRYRNIVHQVTGYSPDLYEKLSGAIKKIIQ